MTKLALNYTEPPPATATITQIESAREHKAKPACFAKSENFSVDSDFCKACKLFAQCSHVVLAGLRADHGDLDDLLERHQRASKVAREALRKADAETDAAEDLDPYDAPPNLPFKIVPAQSSTPEFSFWEEATAKEVDAALDKLLREEDEQSGNLAAAPTPEPTPENSAKAPDLVEKVATEMKASKPAPCFPDWFAPQLALNLDGKQAPAFRPALPFVRGRDASEAGLRARIIIELHWFAVTGQAPAVADPKIQAMFDDLRSGNLRSALEFAERKLPKVQRSINTLALGALQHQVIVLRTKDAKGQLGALQRATGDAITPEGDFTTRRNWWRNRHGNRSVDGLMEIWIARQLLGKGATWAEVAQLAAYMTGAPRLSRTTFLDRETIIRRIAECQSPGLPKVAPWLSNIPERKA